MIESSRDLVPRLLVGANLVLFSSGPIGQRESLANKSAVDWQVECSRDQCITFPEHKPLKLDTTSFAQLFHVTRSDCESCHTCITGIFNVVTSYDVKLSFSSSNQYFLQGYEETVWTMYSRNVSRGISFRGTWEAVFADGLIFRWESDRWSGSVVFPVFSYISFLLLVTVS